MVQRQQVHSQRCAAITTIGLQILYLPQPKLCALQTQLPIPLSLQPLAATVRLHVSL